MFAEMRALVAEGLAAQGAGAARFEVTPFEGDPLHGDLASNAALAAAKALGRAPRELAEALAERVSADARVAFARAAGPGFVNIRLEDAYLEAVSERLASGLELPELGGALSVMTDAAAGQRQVWAAQAALRMARALGRDGAYLEPDAAPKELGDLVGPAARFGDVTAQERVALALELGRARAAAKVGPVQYFGTMGGGFRPGFLDAGAGVQAVALEGMRLPEGLNAEEEEQARIFALTHRGQKRLALTRAALRAATADNPAFLLHYTWAGFAREACDPKARVSAPMSRQMLVRLAGYPELLTLAHRLAEPQRLGLGLVEMARDWQALRRAAPERGENAIPPRLIGAAEIVFSHGFDMLGIEPRSEIT